VLQASGLKAFREPGVCIVRPSEDEKNSMEAADGDCA
jgi:hypothetical protein